MKSTQSVTAEDLLRALQEIKQQLAPAPIPVSRTIGDILERYEDEKLATFSPSNQKDAQGVLHRLARIFHHHTSATLTEEVVQQQLAKIRNAKNGQELGPRTKKKYRDYAFRAIKTAVRRGWWPRAVANPFQDLELDRVDEVEPVILEVSELRQLLTCPKIPVWRRNWYAFRFYTLSRPSEGKALRRSDIGLNERIYQIVRTVHRETTKNGEQRKKRPIHSELWPFLVEQLNLIGDSELVFPVTPTRRNWQTDLVLAGIVTGYRYVCRRKGCFNGFVRESRSEGMRCPKCNYRLSIYGIPKDIRPYNLRHTGVTLYTEAETSDMAVAAMAGHKRKHRSITDRVYTKKRTAMLRREIEKMKLFAPTPKPPTQVEDTQGILPLGMAPGVSVSGSEDV